MKLNITVIPLLFLILQLNAQPIVSPQAGKMNPQKLSSIDAMLNTYINSKHVNGVVAIVHRNNQTVYYKALGYSDVENKKAMETNAIFRIASQTKAITSLAIMMLYEEGKLLLDDPIEKYLPSFRSPRVIQQFNFKDTSFVSIPASRPITIRDLLTHTSGIGYAQIGNDTAKALYAKHGVVGGIGVTDSKITLKNQIDTLGSLPLLHNPGEKFTYGLSIDVLGRLVEVISGIPLAEFFKKRIFDPLDMQDTWFYQPAKNHSRVVPLYSNTENEKITKLGEYTNMLGGLYTAYPTFQGTYYSGGAGLSSTAWDYSRFLQMMINEGVYNGKRLVSRSTVRLMKSNQIGDIEFAMAGQQRLNKLGFGFVVTTDKGSAQSPLSEGSYYGGGAFYSIYWIDPVEKITGQLMINMMPMANTDLIEKFKVMIYQAIED